MKCLKCGDEIVTGTTSCPRCGVRIESRQIAEEKPNSIKNDEGELVKHNPDQLSILREQRKHGVAIIMAGVVLYLFLLLLERSLTLTNNLNEVIRLADLFSWGSIFCIGLVFVGLGMDYVALEKS